MFGTSVLTIATSITRAMPFLLLPLLTAYMSPEDFGYISYIGALAALAAIFIGFSSPSFLIVKWSKLQGSERVKFIAVMLKIGWIMSFVTLILLFFWLNYFSSLKLSIDIIIFIAIIAFARSLFLILDAVLQSTRALGTLAAFLVFQAFLHYGIALYLLEQMLPNWQGKFFGELISSIIVIIATFIYLSRTGLISLRSQRKHFYELTKYCAPLAFHILALWVMGSIDRIMLTEIKGLEAAGVYTVAYLIGMSLDFIHQALSKVWSPWFYRNINISDKQSKDSIVRFTYSYTFFTVLMLIAFLIIVPHIFEFFIDERYLKGAPVIAIVAFGYAFELVRKLFVGYLFALNKTLLIAKLTLLYALLNILLNSFLIPNYGVIGAAWATVLSYMIIAIATVNISMKLYGMPWRSFSISKNALLEPFLDRLRKKD